MAKVGRKRADLGVFFGEKTAKMGEFAGKSPKYARKPGIYAIGSRKLNIIGIWGSKNASGRVRRLRHDYKKGHRMAFIDEMGLRFASDVDFQVLEECSEEILRTRLVYWLEHARKKGYMVANIYGDVGPSDVRKRAEEVPWEPGDRLREMQRRFEIDDERMVGLLQTLERGLEESRGRG